MTDNSNINPWALFGALLKQTAKATQEKKLDELFLLVDQEQAPLTASIRKLANEPDGLARGIILTLAELEKRLPPTKDQAA